MPSAMRTDDFDYSLPAELIAQYPVERRDQSRLMVLDRRTGAIDHDRFDNLGRYLRSGDLLVANRSRVIPARLRAKRATGGAVEVLLLRRCAASVWTGLARPSRKLKAGETLRLEGSAGHIRLVEHKGEGEWLLRLEAPGSPEAAILAAGETPLPPYITERSAPAERYQTVYADRDGSVAAPTAGLHFTGELLDGLRGAGIGLQFVTLHVGLGTFRPVAVDAIEHHVMHGEWGEIPAKVAKCINATRQRGHRVVAVGTTTTRLLESAARNGEVQPFHGDATIFIYPGFTFQAVDALITNFHLPRSTLLMMVSAFAGRQFILEAYRVAIAEKYRFYSFGDAMLIL